MTATSLSVIQIDNTNYIWYYTINRGLAYAYEWQRDGEAFSERRF